MEQAEAAAGRHPNDETLRRVRIVLVRPRGAANVGAVARAMKNMGLERLAFVEPAFSLRSAAVMAVHARDVLAGAERTETVLEAVRDCGLVVGTTCRGGLYRAGAESPEALAPLVLERAASAPVALVFGPEDHGLANEDLKLCQRLLTIDSSALYPSLNLSQAVLLCCYALRRAASGGSLPAKPPLNPAPAADVEFLMERLQAALLRIGFLHPQNPDHIMFALRRILGRAALEDADVRILLGLARQIEWSGRNASREETPA